MCCSPFALFARWLLVLVVAAGIVSSASRAEAGPWTPAPKRGYVKAWARWLPGFGYRDGGGEKRDYGSYHEVSLNLYAELGLVEGLALTLHAPLVQLFVLEDPRSGGSTTHVLPGDPAVGLRWRFLSGWLTAALEAAVRFPLASSDDLQPVFADEPNEPDPTARIGALRGGAGVFDFPLGVAFGHGWRGGFVEGSVGMILRTGGYKHDVYWTLAAGLDFSASWRGRVRLSGRHATGLGGDAPKHDSPSGIGNGTGYGGFALEIDYKLDERWAIGAVLEGGLFALRRQTGGPVINLAISTTF
jgi:hypothetical protein